MFLCFDYVYNAQLKNEFKKRYWTFVHMQFSLFGKRMEAWIGGCFYQSSVPPWAMCENFELLQLQPVSLTGNAHHTFKDFQDEVQLIPRQFMPGVEDAIK